VVRKAAIAALLLGAIAVGVVLKPDSSPTVTSKRLRIAVLGDSDSHAYQDRVMLGDAPTLRGGRFRRETLQWTETLARLRGGEVDQGNWGTWGMPIKVAEVLDFIGVGGRAPRKQDFRFNFAVSGAVCADLHQGYYRQLPRLLREIGGSDDWAGAVVVIRVGINDVGTVPFLDRLATRPDDAEAYAVIDACSAAIIQATDQLLLKEQRLRVVLVGMLDNADWPPNLQRWRSGSETSAIRRGLDRFDEALRGTAARHPGRVVFFDDREWFRAIWGGRDATGQPAYQPLMLGQRLKVEHRQGDDVTHSVLQDGHAGAVWNALWARSLVDTVNSAFGGAITPITIDEILELIDPHGVYSRREATSEPK
jgi:hypothetical protein